MLIQCTYIYFLQIFVESFLDQANFTLPPRNRLHEGFSFRLVWGCFIWGRCVIVALGLSKLINSWINFWIYLSIDPDLNGRNTNIEYSFYHLVPYITWTRHLELSFYQLNTNIPNSNYVLILFHVLWKLAKWEDKCNEGLRKIPNYHKYSN